MRQVRPLGILSFVGAMAWAGVASAAGEPWAPKSELFQLNFRFASITLLFAAAGIALGLLGVALFRIRGPKLQAGTGTVRRHSVGHMLTHWVNAAGFILAAFTGAIMLNWLPINMEMGLLYTLHYIGAGAILIGFVATAVHAVTTGNSRRHRLIPSGAKIKETFIELLGYAGLVGDRGILGFQRLQWPAEMRREIEKGVGFTGFPREGKYLAAEQVLSYPFWAIIGLAIVATGLLKAVRYVYFVPAEVIRWTTILHDWAFVATLVMLVVHVSALVVVKTNWPLFRSMFTGKVRADYAREYHAKWYDELVAELERGEGREAVAPRAKSAPVTGKGR